MHRVWALALAAAGALTGLPEAAEAQRTATKVAGEQYSAGGLVRWLAGSNWRDLWTTPVTVPVLSLDTLGGLEPEEAGGRQSRTLHFVNSAGRQYIFRSVDKYLHKEALPVALRRTPVGDVVQDQISVLMPAAGLLVGPLYDALGLLHPWPRLMVMPDDPRLGEFREVYAGMLGQFEENPQEGPDDTPGFAGSSKLVGVDNFLERLDESPTHRVDATEYLATRLVQFMMGDTDRGADQWRFARFPAPSGNGYVWRPVARDHDFAFMKPGGVIGKASLAAYPKLGHFDDTFDALEALTFMTAEFDRRLLVELPRERWDSVVAAVQSRLTDQVLAAAVERLPDEWQPLAADRIMEGLRARREALPAIAAEFFHMVSYEADVVATDEKDRAEIERLADGSVEIRLYAGGEMVAAAPAAPNAPPLRRPSDGRAVPYFQRRFMPEETREVRLYMLGGDDAVRVGGRAERSIRVRVIGGGGDDHLVDSAYVSGGGWSTTFYTAYGNDDVATGFSTRVDDRTFAERLPGRPLDLVGLAPEPGDEDAERPDEDAPDEAELHEDVADRLVRPRYRNWGHASGYGPAADFRSGSGLLVGAAANYTRYGYRREEYKLFANATALYSIDTGGFGLETFVDYHPENTKLAFSLDASATQFETFRFFGYGNDTQLLSGASPRVFRDQVTVRPAVYWSTSSSYFGFGPIFRYGSPDYDNAGPMALTQPIGSAAFAQAGGAAELRLDHGVRTGVDARGFSLIAGADAYPAFLDVGEAFGSAHGVARAWIPLGWPFLALRAGGEKVWGSFPVHEAAFLGGRNSLRGFETDRFAGDASLYGSGELHAPLGEVELLVRGDLGVFGLADAGRVYVDGESPGGWHTSWGGGVWFSSLGRTLSLAWAKGETERLYLRLGMPF